MLVTYRPPKKTSGIFSASNGLQQDGVGLWVIFSVSRLHVEIALPHIFSISFVYYDGRGKRTAI